MTPVCILTAGSGRRMGPYADIINKALLPYKGKAILSHILEQFGPGHRFVIALGFKGDQVRDYCNAAHPDLKIDFVDIDNFSGPGSGPGYSIYCCREQLQEPFYFIAADTLAEFDTAQTPNDNWVGIANVPREEFPRFCNFITDKNSGFVTETYDKAMPPEGSNAAAFVGLMYIKDYQDFWQSLSGGKQVAGEVQISSGLNPLIEGGRVKAVTVGWQDFGTIDDYEKAIATTQDFNFSKTSEFIYALNGRVIKFFENSTITRQRVEKANKKPGIFPACTQSGQQFYFYDFVPGRTVYEQLTPDVFRALLSWLDEKLWVKETVEAQKFRDQCQDFYFKKTEARVQLFRQKYPAFQSPKSVNEQPVQDIATLLKKLPDDLFNGLPRFMHGDLQFDNIIYDGKQFTLIDWRQDFAGSTDYGDWYYDLAKLLGGIRLNYDYIKKGLVAAEQKGDQLFIDFAVRKAAPLYENILRDYVIGKGLDWNRVQLLTGLIYLNMSPLHEVPFDLMLYGLAQQILTEQLP